MRGLFTYSILLAAIIGLGGCSGGGFVSGKFVLDKASRLPAWFTPTQSVSRQDVEVHITIYEQTTSPVGNVKIKITCSNQVMDKATGTWRWHPKSLKSDHPANPPCWGIFKIRGAEEIYEQTERNDRLRIVDLER
jgi:hypothetical protein